MPKKIFGDPQTCYEHVREKFLCDFSKKSPYFNNILTCIRREVIFCDFFMLQPLMVFDDFLELETTFSQKVHKKFYKHQRGPLRGPRKTIFRDFGANFIFSIFFSFFLPWHPCQKNAEKRGNFFFRKKKLQAPKLWCFGSVSQIFDFWDFGPSLRVKHPTTPNRSSSSLALWIQRSQNLVSHKRSYLTKYIKNWFFAKYYGFEWITYDPFAFRGLKG